MSSRFLRFLTAGLLLAAMAFGISIAFQSALAGSINYARAAVWSLTGGLGLSFIAVYGRG